MEFTSLSEPTIRALQVLLVIALDRVIEIPASYHPLNLFRLIAGNLAHKVNPHRRRNRAHQQLAGAIAAGFLVIPLLLMTYLLLDFAHQPWFFETLILWGIVQSREIFHVGRRIEKNLDKGHKLLARDLLARHTLRETDRLSSLGITKATIEMVSLRLAKQYFAVIFWFMAGGLLPALGLCLLQQLAWRWNRKLPRFQAFGLVADKLSRLLGWLPNQLLALNISLLYNTRNSLKFSRRQGKGWQSCSSGKVLAATAWALQRNLGGPAIYQGDKIRRASVGNQTQVVLSDIGDTLRIYRQVTLTWALVILMMALASLLLAVA